MYTIDKSFYTFDSEKGIFSKLLNRYLVGTDDNHGYLRVTLKCTDGKHHSFMYHKVLWEAINGEIPKGYELNHIDENKHNFKISNLELLTHKENMNYGTRTARAAEKLKGHTMPNHVKKIIIETTSKKVYQYTLDGTLISVFQSAHDAARKTNFNRGNISSCCIGLRKTAHGYIWKHNPL